MILEKAEKILKQPVCDHCLGRQFAQLVSGMTNEDRGKMLRNLAAMRIDHAKYEPETDMSNFAGIKFHNLEAKVPGRRKCAVCGDVFSKTEKFSSNVITKSKGYDFSTFLIGTQLSYSLLEKEEDLWERVGIDYCEPLKAELNREVGKIVEKHIKAKFASRPDIVFLVSVPSGRVALTVNPLHIYGEYQKLVRGIPQTKWPTKKYKTSVEEIIAKPFMKVSRAKGHKLHGLGREDIDARCLGWRPFVLTLTVPRKRGLDIRKLASRIPGKVRVRNMRLSTIEEIRKIKDMRPDKTYVAIVETENKISRSDLRKLRTLIGVIKQKTPKRVVHRRADKYRSRKVVSIRAKLIGPRRLRLTVRGEAGLYVKELINGDDGRTTPSVSSVLGHSARCVQLDVVKIHL